MSRGQKNRTVSESIIEMRAAAAVNLHVACYICSLSLDSCSMKSFTKTSQRPVVVCCRQFRQLAACRRYAGTTAGVGSSTKTPTQGGGDRGGSAGSQHDEDIMSELKETQGKAGVSSRQALFLPKALMCSKLMCSEFKNRHFSSLCSLLQELISFCCSAHASFCLTRTLVE